MINFEQWEGFEGRIWKEEVNVRDFIQKNYTPYDGDESFLAGPTEATDKLWGALQKLQKAERAKGGVLDMETEVVSSLTAYGPGYIDESLKDLEQIVVCRPTSPSSAPSCPTAASRWQSRPAPPTATSPAPSCTRSLPTTPAPTIRQCLMPTLLK